MRQTQKRRTVAIVRHELSEAAQRRRHAAVWLDFEAYQNLTEQIDDLLAELSPLLPAQRTDEP